MPTRLLILLGYLTAVIAIGVAGRRRARAGEEDFFLAGRTLGPLVLLATMAATNFSAFTVVGFAGAGYRLGFAFYPIMAFGTGLMALSFVVVGVPIYRLGKRYGLITPPELLTARFGSRPLTTVFAVAMAVFTLPYLAIQPMAAGYALESLLGLPYAAGAALVTALVLAYVLLGGLRSVAWTDVLQGVTMFVLLFVGFLVVAGASGGVARSFSLVAGESPDHFARPGAGGGLLLGVWASYMLLWFLADPMFPQLFQRFYAARSERSIVRTMVFYPVVTTVLFFFPVAIGVLGRLHFAGLTGKETDRILPLLMERFGGNWLAALASAGLIAAIMSTMDSQLLTLGSIVERDLLGRGAAPAGGAAGGRPRAPTLLPARVALAVLAVLGYLLALRPPATILAIATETFSGLAVLFPAVVATLYWRRATAAGSIASIAVGEALVVLYHFKLVPTFGLLPAIPAVAAAALVLVAAGLIMRPARDARPGEWRECVSLGLSRRAKAAWTVVFAAFFLLAVDWWRFGRAPGLLAGLPDWIGYFVVLGIVLALVFALFGRAVLGSYSPAGANPSGPASTRSSREVGTT
jgi:SSS family solute:Na+ symporter